MCLKEGLTVFRDQEFSADMRSRALQINAAAAAQELQAVATTLQAFCGGFDAQKALAWGMVEEVVPVAELDATIGRVLDDLLAGAPHALALQKRLIGEWEERGMAGAIAAGIDSFAEAWTTPEPGARMRHFLESKRK